MRHLKNYLLDVFSEKDNFNVYVKRKHKFSSIGRNQTKEESEAIDNKIREFIDNHKIPILTIDGTQSVLEELFLAVSGSLRKNGIQI
jgi:D-alanine-D-alanine ligase-like ATP-grasp enzyme